MTVIKEIDRKAGIKIISPEMKILDCTLRDGGYYTNWDFNEEITDTYIKNIEKLPVDIIEIGYRSISKTTYFGKFFYLPTYEIERLRKRGLTKEVAIMLNEKDVTPNDLKDLFKGLHGLVSVIRLAVDPANLERALVLAKSISRLGFQVSLNLMYMSKFVFNTEFLEQLKGLENTVKYICLVDSYGGMYPEQVKERVSLVKSTCNIEVGFHGHNNLEMALANTIAAIQGGATIVDGTITGMGRGAGNLKTEMLLTYLSAKEEIGVDFDALSEIVEEFSELQKIYGWGTNLPYMISGSNSLAQSDVMKWITERNYSVNSIVRALNNRNRGRNDNLKLPYFKRFKKYGKVLVIGGGPSVNLHANALINFIKKHRDIALVFASAKNAEVFAHLLDYDKFYCLVGNEGHRLEKTFNGDYNLNEYCVLPCYPREMGTYVPKRLKDRAYELEEIKFTSKYRDGHTTIALQTALYLGVDEVYLAGYDGYNQGTLTIREHNLSKENEYLFGEAKKSITISSVTPSNYALVVNSVYTLL